MMGIVARMAWRSFWRRLGWHLPVGLTVTLGAFVVALNGSIVEGVTSQLQDAMLVTQFGHLRVTRHDSGAPPAMIPEDAVAQLEARLGEVLPGAAVAEELSALGMVHSDYSSSSRVAFWGVDGGADGMLLSSLADRLGGTSPPLGSTQLLLGAALAERLEVSVGDEVTVTVPDVAGDLNAEDFQVSGVLQRSAPWQDYFAYVAFEDLSRLAQARGATSLKVYLPDGIDTVRDARDAARPVVTQISPSLQLETCWESGGLYVGIIRANRIQLVAMNAVLLVAVALGLASLQLLAVHERRNEFGTMMALGTPKSAIHALVMVEGSAVAIAFAFIGSVIATICVMMLQNEGIDIGLDGVAWMVGSRRIAPLVCWHQLFSVPFTFVCVVGLSGIWPAIRCTSMKPVQAIKEYTNG